MATITSASSTAAITAAYLDNCGYYEDDDADMARRFVTACTAMLARGISEVQHAGELMRFSPPDLRALLADAQKFAASRATASEGGTGVKYASFEDFRS